MNGNSIQFLSFPLSTSLTEPLTEPSNIAGAKAVSREEDRGRVDGLRRGDGTAGGPDHEGQEGGEGGGQEREERRIIDLM